MTEADFLLAILDQPDDDVLRLAFADFLMERGGEENTARGEFIQVQVQLARRAAGSPGEWIDAARLPELKKRERDLLFVYGVTWAGPIAQLVLKYEFRRGFVEHVSMNVDSFTTNAKSLFARAPVRRIRISNGIHHKFAHCEYLEKLTGLDLSRGGFGDPGLRILLESPHLTNLSWLDLSHCYLTDRGIAEFAASPLIGRLSYLNLANNYITHNGVQALFDSPHWGKLRQLSLADNYSLDSRLSRFLAQRLQGQPDPALLRTILQAESTQTREYSNAEVREIALRAGRDPQLAPAVLTDALDAGNYKTRRAAATMLAQLGESGSIGLPKLVQRLYDAKARNQVASALARLLPAIRPEMQRWLCLLANPLTSPSANLRDALARADLPTEARERFAEVCARRQLWRDHIEKKLAGPAPLPAPGSWKTDTGAVWLMVNALLDRAGRHAARHPSGDTEKQLRDVGMKKEAAWLIARLTELLQASLSATTSPAGSTSGRQARAGGVR